MLVLLLYIQFTAPPTQGRKEILSPKNVYTHKCVHEDDKANEQNINN